MWQNVPPRQVWFCVYNGRQFVRVVAAVWKGVATVAEGRVGVVVGGLNVIIHSTNPVSYLIVFLFLLYF